ncbi:MAG: alpha/beta hydrolase [Bacteroidota bacterium]
MKKKLINLASTVFPQLFTKIAYDKLINPQVRKLRENELAVLSQARQEDYAFQNFQIKVYTWGEQGEEVLLIHGWEGQAGNFSDLVQKLRAKQYKVIAFDAPSHGFSSKGETSLLEFSALVGNLIRRYQVKKLISHSFGGVATTYALYNNQDLEIDKYVMLTTPDRFQERIDNVVQQIGISDKVKKQLINQLEAENNFKVETLNVSDFVKVIRVKQSLIIHDKNDRVIPIQQSLHVHQNWGVSNFQTVEGTGHFRILRTEKVLDAVADFLG